MATKTVTLTGAEQRVDELGGLNALIVNNTTQPLYASAKAGVTPYADGVIEIKAGDSRGLPDTNGTVYLLGNGGRAELTGTSASVNFNVPSSSSEGGGGITRDEVNDIVTDKIKADIGNVSNPNLLDNPDFRINQRGQSEYSGASTYTVDRWRTINNTKVKVFDDHIEIEQMGTTQTSIMQYCENISELAGKTVTFSAEVRGDGIHIPKLQFVNSDGVDMYAIGTNSTDWQIISLTTVISKNADVNNNFPRIYVSTDNTNKPIIGVKWAKLELGNHATPFVPPNPALELLKCQRYYQKYSNMRINAGYLSSETSATWFFNYKTMRVTPTILGLNTLYVDGLSSIGKNVSFSVLWNSSLLDEPISCLRINGVFAENIMNYARDGHNFPLTMNYIEGSVLELSADL